MVFQPASLQSNLHKQLRAAADKHHVKTQRVGFPGAELG
jgi:hypothetical protein